MSEGLTVELILAGITVGLMGFWISSRDLSMPTAFLVTGIKVMLPLLYFAFFFDGTWTFYDDINYQNQGERMLQLGYNPFTALFTPAGIKLLSELSQGHHILYGWWNLLAQYLFGEKYYPPVFLNVILTFVCGYFLFRLARLSGFGQAYAKGLLLFFLLHWDVLAWSSFTNLKDIMIMTLTTISICLILKLSKKINVNDGLALAAIAFTFFWIRFYIPFLILITTILWLALYQKGKRRYMLLFLAVISTLIAIQFVGLERLLYYFRVLDISFIKAITGSIRMALTPQPWSIEPSYSFLFLPSILHWTFFVPALVSGVLLWRRSKEVNLLIIYLLLILLLYSFYDLLQGTRHRVQVVPIIVWLQFHFVWVLLKVSFSDRSKRYYKQMAHLKSH